MAMKNYKDSDDSGAGRQKMMLIALGALLFVGLFLQFIWPGNLWW